MAGPIAAALLGFLAAPILLFSQDFLVWDDGVRLVWDDFRGRPDPASPPHQGAESHLSITVGFSCTHNAPDLRIAAEFDRIRSWSRPDMPASLLEHEQIHFDITAIYARRAREEAEQVPTPCQNASAIRAIAERNLALAGGLHEMYDQETRHGTRPGAQAEWSRRIRSLLRDSR